MSAFSPSPRFEFQAWRHAVPTAIRLARRMLETRLLLILFWPYQEPPETDAYNVDGVLKMREAHGCGRSLQLHFRLSLRMCQHSYRSSGPVFDTPRFPHPANRQDGRLKLPHTDDEVEPRALQQPVQNLAPVRYQSTRTPAPRYRTVPPGLQPALGIRLPNIPDRIRFAMDRPYRSLSRRGRPAGVESGSLPVIPEFPICSPTQLHPGSNLNEPGHRTQESKVRKGTAVLQLLW